VPRARGKQELAENRGYRFTLYCPRSNFRSSVSRLISKTIARGPSDVRNKARGGYCDLGGKLSADDAQFLVMLRTLSRITNGSWRPKTHDGGGFGIIDEKNQVVGSAVVTETRR
jgi:hypothetical protein